MPWKFKRNFKPHYNIQQKTKNEENTDCTPQYQPLYLSDYEDEDENPDEESEDSFHAASDKDRPILQRSNRITKQTEFYQA